MVFSSLFFVFLFLPICLLLHTMVKGISAKNIVLLFFSLIFYAWSGPAFLIILITDTFLCWIFSLAIDRAKDQKKKKLFLILNIISVLGILCYFKYAMMLMGGWNVIMGALPFLSALKLTIPEIVLPIGISFYTFQLITYTVDVYKGSSKVQNNFFTLLLYSSLFHQCIAGPIIRYDEVAEEIKDRKITISSTFNGIVRFSIGLAKKAVLANGCAAVADQFLPASVLPTSTTLGILVGAFAYMLQIYLDFSAYSDMAIGMGLMMGFHFPENFKHPYVSRSVTDFWRRWHITLSSFFRDYVYIPLGGNRVSTGKHIKNMFIVWFLTGLWHGAHVNFILWGLYYFIFLVLEKNVLKDKLKKIPYLLGMFITLIVVYFGWILFYYSDFALLKTALSGIFLGNANGFSNLTTGLFIKNNIFLLIFSIFACTPIYYNFRKIMYKSYAKAKQPARNIIMWDAFISVVCLILSMLALIGDSYNPFLYFQF